MNDESWTTLNMKYTKKYTLFLLVIVILFGCSKQPNDNLSVKDKQFAITVHDVDMNENLSVVVESKKEQFSSGSEIPLLIVNKSSHSISLQMNTDLKLLMYTSDQWVEIQNSLKYSGDNLLLSPQGNIPSDQLRIFVKPVFDEDILEDENASVLLRVVVLGETMTGETPTGENVGAYTDVSLKDSAAKPTYVIIQSTAETITFDGGAIRGSITSADKVGEPLPNVIIQLETHPFFNESNQIKIIATTTTDADGNYYFDQVEPGIYALHTKILLMQGGACESTDWSKSIKIEIGSVVTANLSLACS
jgi:hypothetical protein